MNPFLGVFFHWLGGFASGSFYVPYRFVRKWSWETAWMVGGFFSWIIMPSLLALLAALLQPIASIRDAEQSGALWERLALMEEAKTLPMGAVWEEFLRRNDVPADWMAEVRTYEASVLAGRS